jgi:1-acyl-sn-glycerol-3-phosphate acyltransferase
MGETSSEPRISPLLVFVLRPIHTLFVPAFFRIKVRHKERIPNHGPVILTPTHRSRWDPMIMPYLTRRLLRSMASHDEFVGVQGWFMGRLGAFPVNTRRPSPSTLKRCVEILESNDVLVIYPEGTIFYYPPDHVHPLRPGTAWIALRAQQAMPDSSVAVVPVRIRYSQLKPKFRSGVDVLVQPPIWVKDYLASPERDAIRGLTEAIQAGMGDVVNSSRQEMSTPRDPNAPRQRGVYGSPRESGADPAPPPIAQSATESQTPRHGSSST